MTELMTMSPPRGRKPFALTGWHVLAMIVAFFAVVIAVDVGFTVMAVRSFPGEVSKTPYEDGLRFNRRRAQLDAQAALGWRVQVETGALGVVRARFVDRVGRPVSGLLVTGTLERPATDAGEMRLGFREIAPGLYEGVAPAKRGGWDLSLIARAPSGERFEAESRLSWR